MRSLAAACIYALLTFPASASDPRWIRIQSPNFELYSTASERSARETLEEFEQVRAFFLNTLPTKDQKPLSVRIVTFNSVKEYEPYRFNEFATAYYYPGAERDTIVMSHGGSENFPTAIHEYVHLVVQHAGVKPPPWLNEGLAEFYSTLRPLGGKIVVGDIIPGRLAALRADNWVPLSVILAADQNSPYYNEKNKAGSFYNEGWALTHMLSLSDEYRPKWKEFVAAVIKGRDAAEALSQIYGKPLAAIDQDLQYYIRGSRFLAGNVRCPVGKSEPKLRRRACARVRCEIDAVGLERAARQGTGDGGADRKAVGGAAFTSGAVRATRVSRVATRRKP